MTPTPSEQTNMKPNQPNLTPRTILTRHHYQVLLESNHEAKAKQSDMSSKHGRVVLLPAPAAAESQRLVRDARCARASSASSAPTPAAAGAFPLVRDHCHHQFAPPGASPGVNSRSPTGPGAYIVTTPVRCSLTDCKSRVSPICTRSVPWCCCCDKRSAPI